MASHSATPRARKMKFQGRNMAPDGRTHLATWLTQRKLHGQPLTKWPKRSANDLSATNRCCQRPPGIKLKTRALRAKSKVNIKIFESLYYRLPIFFKITLPTLHRVCASLKNICASRFLVQFSNL